MSKNNMKNVVKSAVLTGAIILSNGTVFADENVNQELENMGQQPVEEQVQEEPEVNETPVETLEVVDEGEAIEPLEVTNEDNGIELKEVENNRITSSELKEDMEVVDDYMIFGDDITITGDHEGNIAANKATINNSSLGNTSNVDEESSNVNYIENLEGFTSEARQDTTILVGKENNVIGETDNGNAVTIDGQKIGMKDNVNVEYIEEDINIEGELDKLAETSKELAKLKTNTITGVEENTNKVHIKAEENDDEFTVVSLKGSDLQKGENEYYVQTEEGKTTIMNIDTEGIKDLIINAKFWFDEVRADWNDKASNILWNFFNKNEEDEVEAYDGKITTTDLMMGTMLAPKAEVYVGAGNWNGSIICDTFLGNNAEVHKVDFKVDVPEETPEEPEVPEETPETPEEPQYKIDVDKNVITTPNGKSIKMNVEEKSDNPKTGDVGTIVYTATGLASILALFGFNKKKRK